MNRPPPDVSLPGSYTERIARTVISTKLSIYRKDFPTPCKHFPTGRRAWNDGNGSQAVSPVPSQSPVLVAEVLELQRDVGYRLAHQRDDFLQCVFFGTGDAHQVALDAALYLQLAVLDELDDALGALLLDALAHLDRFLHLVAGDRLHFSGLERADVHTALRELAGQDVAHLAQLEFVVTKRG